MQKANLNNITFEELSNDWLEYKKAIIKESSYLNYKFTIKTKFIDEFGDKSLSTLLSYNFNMYVSKIMERLSSKTARDVIIVLKAILKYAELKYDISFKTRLISTPNPTENEVEVFKERDRRKIEKYCINSKELKDIGVMISLYTGLRIGEVCALKWRDIDFEKKMIRVTHTLQRVYVDKNTTKVLYDKPKTKKSIRSIPIAKILYEKLKPLSKKYSKDSFILSGDEERFYEPLSYRNTYKYILDYCGIEYKKYHILRHTFATRCIAVGMDIKSLSEILGHANVSITLNIYVHSCIEVKNKYINKL